VGRQRGWKISVHGARRGALGGLHYNQMIGSGSIE
jgi:hypothetical protein